MNQFTTRTFKENTPEERTITTMVDPKYDTTQPGYVKELDELQKTLNMLGELQDVMHNKLSPVRCDNRGLADPYSEPTNATTESPLVTTLKSLNYQATRILQNFSNTYDQIDL